MCGISGVVSRRPVNAASVGRMNEVQRHRGPDGAGTWSSIDGCVVLGHRRLAIIDLSNAAAQPMASTDGEIVITFNGEIYNYLELRAELVSMGSHFASQSDTEVVIEAYRQWGRDCLSRLNGMFAFAIHDRRRGRLFCARDRYAEKPFLFCAARDFFAFASEYKALLQLREVGREFDEMRLVRAAALPSRGFDSDRQTVFHDIQQLLPSEALELDERTLAVEIWRYWDVPHRIEPSRYTEGEAGEAFAAVLRDSVRIRMRSDVEVGSCLSGGLDSSAIACIIRSLVGPGAAYHTFTGRFPNTPADEWEYASEVVRHADTTSHVVNPTAERLVEELPRFVWHNELPVGTTSQYAQWCVFALAKECGITVLLDGQGADEQLGGYEQYFGAYVASLAQAGETARLSDELPRIRDRYPLALQSTHLRWRDRLPFRMRHWVSNHVGMGTNPLFGVRPEVASVIAAQSRDEAALDGFPPLHGALYRDTFGRFLTTLLRYGDRNSMAHSREVRLPFCDHRIAELAFSLPPSHLMGDAQTKRLLRRSTAGLLPEKIRLRWNKRGFLPPQDRWFQSKVMVACVRETLSSRQFTASPYWLPVWWNRALDRLEAGDGQLGWTLWQPFIVEAWKRDFVGALGPSVSIH